MPLLYLLAGMNHFRNPKFYLPMMPPWIPAHKFMIALSGIAEISVAILLSYEPTRVFGAWITILMLIAFMPVHIYMIQVRHTVFKRVKPFILYLRIPLQFLLIYWAWTYTYL